MKPSLYHHTPGSILSERSFMKLYAGIFVFTLCSLQAMDTDRQLSWYADEVADAVGECFPNNDRESLLGRASIGGGAAIVGALAASKIVQLDATRNPFAALALSPDMVKAGVTGAVSVVTIFGLYRLQRSLTDYLTSGYRQEVKELKTTVKERDKATQQTIEEFKRAVDKRLEEEMDKIRASTREVIIAAFKDIDTRHADLGVQHQQAAEALARLIQASERGAAPTVQQLTEFQTLHGAETEMIDGLLRFSDAQVSELVPARHKKRSGFTKFIGHIFGRGKK